VVLGRIGCTDRVRRECRVKDGRNIERVVAEEKRLT
jgi:hypothetical protein